MGCLLGLALLPGADPAAQEAGSSRQLDTGLTVETVPLGSRASESESVTIVRVDPRHFDFRLLTAAEHGARTADEWAEAFGLTGVINASMFRPDHRSTGLMIDDQTVNNGWENPHFGAFFAFGPRDADLEPVRLLGRGCPGFDLAQLQRDYRVVVQNYRMLDCSGEPILWKDDKRYSIAAIGLDDRGNVVLLHSRAQHRVREFNEIIARPDLGLTAAMFVEGGPEASLLVQTDRGRVSCAGSWDSRLFEDPRPGAWRIPNVIGFAPRDRRTAIPLPPEESP